MRRTLALLIAAIAATVFLAVPAGAATQTAIEPDAPQPTPYPDEWGREITRWDQIFDLQADGSADVTLEIDFDFGNDPGHGPYMVLPVRQGFDGSLDRLYPVTNVTATSPTGAPAKVYLSEDRNWLTVRVGDEYIGDVSGVQTYVITWTVHHVMNDTTDAEMGGTTDEHVADEFYWNAVGDGWTIPISYATVTVLAPVEATAAQCFAGAEYSTGACDSVVTTPEGVVFSHGYLYPGQPFTVDLLYPAGTFDTAPSLTESSDVARAFRITPWTGGAALLILAGGIIWLWRRLATTAVDEQYAGLTPGLTPAGELEHQVVKRDYATPVSVQFEPPLGMRPGQVGTLMDEKADPRDVTATVVDLAVRGYLRIDYMGEVGTLLSKQAEYRLVKLRPPDPALVEYEMTLYDAIFEGRDEVTFSQMRTTFAADMRQVQNQLYANVTALGWFRRNPTTARVAWGAGGFFITLAGIVVTVVLAQATSIALVGLPIILVGIATIATIRNAPARTADGTAALEQARGFERFLVTADANQLRYEEGHDIFSRFLPFAIAFGVADKWAKKFEELAKQGVKLANPSWYGNGSALAAGAFWANTTGFGDQLTQFASLADATMSAPTPGSSGGSGFSGGGGGSSGGGGGGGGGGGW